MNSTDIITIVSCVIGSGGISALATSFFSARKYKAEALKTEQEAQRIREQSKIEEMEYVRNCMKSISEDSRKENGETKKHSEELSSRVDELNDKLQAIMEWVIYDNQRYRSWLEDELRKRDPNIEFPTCAPPPKIFQSKEQRTDET